MQFIRLAVHRRDANIEQQIDTLTVQVSAIPCFWRGASEDIARLSRRNEPWRCFKTIRTRI